MEIQKNVFVDGLHQKPILVDIYFQANQTPKPVIIFAHGFKGFKDWGHFDLVAREFANQNFAFVKFNFSHNGTTPENPLSFNDLEAFGHNNFSIELDDLKSVMNFILGEKSPLSSTEITREQLYLLGHSRGGGIVILKAREDERVKKIVTWASVNEFGKFWPEETIEEWKENGVLFVENARTGQQMPLYWQLYENYYQHRERLYIPEAVKKLSIPFLIVHGTNDPAVPFQLALEMNQWNPHSKLLTIEGGDHTFGGAHPWEKDVLPKDARRVVQETIEFLKSER